MLLPQGLHLLLGTGILEFLQNAFPTENTDSFLPFVEHLIDHCLLNGIIVLLLRFLREIGSEEGIVGRRSCMKEKAVAALSLCSSQQEVQCMNLKSQKILT